MSCRVLLDGEETYCTNSLIFGHLEVSFSREVTVKSLSVVLECIEESTFLAKPEATENKPNERSGFCMSSFRSTGHSVSYRSQCYVLKAQPVYITIKGKQLYAFTIHIPKDLPPSMTIPFGSIVYTLTGIIELQLFRPIQTVHIITVISPTTAMSYPLSVERFLFVRDHYLLFKKGLLGMKVSISTSVFIPGELITINVELKNFTKKKAASLRFSFIKRLIIYATRPNRKLKHIDEKIFDFMSDGIPPFKRCTYAIRMRIPKGIEILKLKNSQLFQHIYKLSITCNMSVLGRNLQIDLYPEMAQTKWTEDALETDAAKLADHMLHDCSYVLLNCKTQFAELSFDEKMYAYHLAEAAWTGALVTISQTSPGSPLIFILLHKLFYTQRPPDFRECALNNGFSRQEIDSFYKYAAGFFCNMGNYKAWDGKKFIPSLTLERMEQLLQLSPVWNFLNPIWQKIQGRMYDLSYGKKYIGMPPTGLNCFMSKNISQEDVDVLKRWMKTKGFHGYNCRIFKTVTIEKTIYELRLASAESSELSRELLDKHTLLKVTKGDFSSFMIRIAASLNCAIEFAANDEETDMLLCYCNAFLNGTIEDHKEATRYWINDWFPSVDAYLGFIYTYRDPHKLHGEFTSLVALPNNDMTDKFYNLLSKGEDYLKLLPWPNEFNDDFEHAEFTIMQVLALPSKGFPVGIRLPFYEDIRNEVGVKYICFTDVIAAKLAVPNRQFLRADDVKLIEKHVISAMEIKMALHELFGHGSGKMFYDTSSPDDFSPYEINPLTGKPLLSFYRTNDTYESIFKELAWAYEECRAEAIALYLALEKQVLKEFNYKGDAALDLVYVMVLVVAWNGIGRALEYWDYERGWVHDRHKSTYVLTQVLVEGGLVKVTQPKPNEILIALDRNALFHNGKKVLGDFILRLQVFKSTGNVNEANKLFKYYSEVRDPWLRWRDIVMFNRPPRPHFVQTNTRLEGHDVVLRDYEASADGLILSWVERYRYPDQVYEELMQLYKQNEFHCN